MYDTGRGRRQQWGPNQRTAGEDNNEDDDQRDDNDNKETTKSDVPATAWDETQDTSKGKEPDGKLAYQVPLTSKPASCDEAAKLGYLRLEVAGEGECFFKAFVHTDAFAHGPPLDVNYDFSGASGRGEGVHASKII